MTISEFRAWLEGFSEAIDGAPTPEQWEKVKDKIGQIAEPAHSAPNMPYPFAPPIYPGTLPVRVPDWYPHNQLGDYPFPPPITAAYPLVVTRTWHGTCTNTGAN